MIEKIRDFFVLKGRARFRGDLSLIRSNNDQILPLFNNFVQFEKVSIQETKK